MRIGIVACEILKNEIEELTEADPEVVHREYLEFGLHDTPELLRETIVRKINALEGNVDIIFLGYAICKSLKEIQSDLKLPVIMLREEDCIGSLLGPIKYAEERLRCPGTWFSSPGWSVLGIDAVVNDKQMKGLEEQGFDKIYFVKKELEGYSRCLYISTGVQNEEGYREKAVDFSDKIGLKFEYQRGDPKPLRNAWQAVKKFSVE